MLGLTEADTTLLLVGALAAAATFGVGVLNYFATRRNREVAERAVEVLDTGNDKHLGTTVHDIAQTVEVLEVNLHMLSGKLDSHLRAHNGKKRK